VNSLPVASAVNEAITVYMLHQFFLPVFTNACFTDDKEMLACARANVYECFQKTLMLIFCKVGLIAHTVVGEDFVF
jgi:hypothetical protein